tara:strand:+ start:4639 stop:5145 length:507 start_codon:yes stop_codon:yes gene_type:complete
MKYLPNAKIYKLSDLNSDDVYYGSTIQTLQQRLNGHKSSARGGHNLGSSTIINNGDYRIDLVENYPCNTMKELHQREQLYISKNPCLNKISSYVSDEDKKLKCNQRSADYYIKYKDDLLEKKKVYDDKYYQCECGSRYNMSHRARHCASYKHTEFISHNNFLNDNKDG